MKNWINRVLNLAIYLCLCFIVGTGWVMWYRLPPRHGQLINGRHGEPAPQILGLDRHEWGDYHFYVAVAFITLCLVHLYMNRTWLTRIAASRQAWRLWLGLAAGLGIVAFFAIMPTG